MFYTLCELNSQIDIFLILYKWKAKCKLYNLVCKAEMTIVIKIIKFLRISFPLSWKKKRRESLKYRNNLKEFKDFKDDIAVLALWTDCIT